MTGGAADAVGVVDPTGRFHASVAELPLSTRRADRASGAIVVTAGVAGWVDAALAASAAGAAAVVVADPEFVPAAEVRRLAQGLDIPVILERPLLRVDVTRDAADGREGASPRLLVADGAASERRLPAVARDAVGWLRVLSGQDLAVVSAEGALALLETGAGIAATLSIAVTARLGRGWIRTHALGETITEVEVDGSGSQVTTVSSRGRLTSPIRFESSERHALRRAVSALTAPDQPVDLRELLADTELVERMLRLAP